MVNPELNEVSSAPQEKSPIAERKAQRFIVIGTWAMSRGEPHLFFWRDRNSYANDPDSLAEVTSDAEINDVARRTISEELAEAGIDDKRAEAAVKKVEQAGRIGYRFTDYVNGNWVVKKKILPLVFVEVMPSVLNDLLKRDAHLLHPAWVMHPDSKWLKGYPIERSMEKAFKKFAAKKQGRSQIEPK